MGIEIVGEGRLADEGGATSMTRVRKRARPQAYCKRANSFKFCENSGLISFTTDIFILDRACTIDCV